MYSEVDLLSFNASQVIDSLFVFCFVLGVWILCTKYCAYLIS